MHIYLKDDIELIDEQHTMQLVKALPDWRRDIAMRFKFISGKRECAIAYHLLCQALREKYQITAQPHFTIGEHGKPSLLEFPTIHFNLSHCAKAVICAVDDKPIGVDIERIRPAKDSLINYTMNEKEIGQIKDSEDPDLAFTRLWTAKEAVFKLMGTGIQDNIKDSLTLIQGKDVRLSTHNVTEKGYVYSIASEE